MHRPRTIQGCLCLNLVALTPLITINLILLLLQGAPALNLHFYVEIGRGSCLLPKIVLNPKKHS